MKKVASFLIILSLSFSAFGLEKSKEKAEPTEIFNGKLIVTNLRLKPSVSEVPNKVAPSIIQVTNLSLKNKLIHRT